jgi:hypothetical protein
MAGMGRVNLAVGAGVILVSSIAAAAWRRRVAEAAWPVPAPRPWGPVPVPSPEPAPSVPPQVSPRSPGAPWPPQPRRGMRLLLGGEELFSGHEDVWW